METLQQSLVRFYASFITNRTNDSQLNSYLVKKMLKNKSVQKIIIDSMCKLDPIINEEIISVFNPKNSNSQRKIMKKSKLLSLADDIKDVMKNYEFIQGKISNMKDIVENLDFSYENIMQIPEESELNPSPGAAYSFLSAIHNEKKTTNDEINEISQQV